jgi:glutamine amidotransferase
VPPLWGGPPGGMPVDSLAKGATTKHGPVIRDATGLERRAPAFRSTEPVSSSACSASRSGAKITVVAAPTVFVLDYERARTRRLMAALAVCGVEARLTETPLSARQADVLVVPDGDDSEAALSRGMAASTIDAIAQHAARERPLLAVGLGLCFLLSGRTHPAMPVGADVFRAPVQHFDTRLADEGERPLMSPHTGASVVVGLDRQPALCSLVPRGVPGLWFHFRHRLCAPARIPQADVAVAHHGVPFAAVIWRGSTVALQFLPEQSGPAGLDVLRAFFARSQAATSPPLAALTAPPYSALRAPSHLPSLGSTTPSKVS